MESWKVGELGLKIGKLEVKPKNWEVFVGSPPPQENLFLVEERGHLPAKMGKCRRMGRVVACIYICTLCMYINVGRERVCMEVQKGRACCV